ncbi:hypothetical protein CDN99_21905 [Roseateles aquatilis]|uniref:Uncharacterized protein n=1 Tax=Roseateles aquatilis TaxID=431061 RepID=A0A246IZT9_9BURK|nr:hypothetical protein [Roseateles aquatilis]OWQ85732.1 hypothetical protein CDN99_21905 [Roseateles aquatilis]
MFVNPGFGILTSLLSGVGACLCLVCLDGRPWQSHAEMTALREQQVRMWHAAAQSTVLGIVPNSSRDCGFVALGADPSAALKCVEHAERHQLAYWVASEAQGIDSHVWVVVLKDADGASQLLLDSYGWETSASRRPRFGVTELPCEAVEVHAAVHVKDSDGFAMYQPAFDCRR